MTSELRTDPFNPIDNPSPGVAQQISEYVATDGVKPVFRNNAPLLLLTVQGRKSGQWHRTALIYGRMMAAS